MLRRGAFLTCFAPASYAPRNGPAVHARARPPGGHMSTITHARAPAARAFDLPGLVAVVLVALVALATPGLAEYPERPVTIVVPFVPGGANDIVVRILTEPLGKALGQTVVVENRGGAGGSIGAVAVAHAQPDGYTLLMGSTSFAVNPSLQRRAGYDPFKDFAPVVDMVFFPCVIAVRKDF